MENQSNPLFALGPQAEAKATRLVHFFHGTMDPGNAGRLALEQLLEASIVGRYATFNADELIDYRASRPLASVENWELSNLDTAQIVIDLAIDLDGQPFLLLHGPEPDFRWEAFTEALATIIARAGVEEIYSLLAVPAALPHTRPLQLHVLHGEPRKTAGMPFNPSTLDRPSNETPGMRIRQLPAVPANPQTHFNPGLPSLTSAEGEGEPPRLSSAAEEENPNVLKLSASLDVFIMYRLARRGFRTRGLVVSVPYYLFESEYFPAAAELLRALSSMAHLSLPLGDLDAAAAVLAPQLEAMVQASPDNQALIASLEENYDSLGSQSASANPDFGSFPDLMIPDEDEIGRQLENFLKSEEDKNRRVRRAQKPLPDMGQWGKLSRRSRRDRWRQD
ncbi:hypothetical protein BSR28_03275 [Boudabousia liubingyangii]|uniref:PAC2 family protein n=1 Tax=Boudabousia liubingyangii TaxID=1921764 RepID=UPI00093E4035|nr:PAC2 family protein [Boudabousia liubingyangii]OKL47533.1 hypothetical protein BSR28_03275 [Boudabousia liubingyangii]